MMLTMTNTDNNNNHNKQHPFKQHKLHIAGHLCVSLLIGVAGLCQLATTNVLLVAGAEAGAIDSRSLSMGAGEFVTTRPPGFVAAATAAGFIFAEDTDRRLNLSDPIDESLSKILNRTGPDLRSSRDHKDFPDVTLEVSKRAWTLLHEHTATAVRDRIDLAEPIISRTLNEAGVSGECRDSITQLFLGAKRMESWALKMINSWGNFPAIGIFEGTYSEMGSFHTCVNVQPPASSKVGHAHYCSITYRPIMPSRKNYELVVTKEPDELLRLFERQPAATADNNNIRTTHAGVASGGGGGVGPASAERARDAFTDILEHAQYHHYLYYKWGTCWPIHCSPFDIKRVSKLLARRNILMGGPVKCYSKFEDDYEQPGSAEDSSSSSSGGVSTNNGAANGSSRADKKLVISSWDLNDGIYIWKPYFNGGQKAALAVVLTITFVMVFLTLCDLFINRVPQFVAWIQGLMRGSSIVSDDIRLRAAGRAAGDGQKRAATTQTRGKDSSNGGGNINNHEENHSSLQSFCPKLAPVGASQLSTMIQHQTQQATNQFQDISLGVGRDHSPAGTQEVAFSCTSTPVVSSTPATRGRRNRAEKSLFMGLVSDFSIINNAAQFFTVSESQRNNDIMCLYGIRCITMTWIILTHTMMYNDWSQFARTREIEKSIKSIVTQPIFNGSYQVDTFFLMSGLLSSFTAFRHCEGLAAKFKSFAYIFGRWLRLTPQIFFVSMLFILVPLVSYGPHWYPVVAEYSENCIDNWWINVLHLQSFYQKDKMCNFVTWWISIDFFYHIFALAILWVVLLAGHRIGFLTIAGIISSHVIWQTIKHFQLSLPPNMLSSIPATGAMWTEMTLNFFWTPYTHAVPFFFGFYLGYLMALKRKLIMRQLNTRRATIGWVLTVSLLGAESFSTHWWVTGEMAYSRLGSTVFYLVAPIIWSGSLCWIIVACHHGYGGFVNRVLSWNFFTILGKASYMVYLSHFQVMFMFYGNQSLLLEPSVLVMIYVVLGNVFLSMLYGIFLYVVYEMPWLSIQRKLLKYI